MSDDVSARRQRHWSSTRMLTIVVLLIWLTFGFILPWFARELDAFEFLGFELGYYIIVQGSLIVFVVLIWVQNWIQDSIDRLAGVSEEEGA